MFRFAITAMLLTATAVCAQSTTFEAASILPADVLNGKTYRVAPQVGVSDHRFQFSIETQYGTFPASGILMLEKRLSELNAIEAAAKLGQSAVAIEEAWKTIQRTPQGAGHLLLDPLGTLAAVPTGFQRMASSVLNPVDRRLAPKRDGSLQPTLVLIQKLGTQY